MKSHLLSRLVYLALDLGKVDGRVRGFHVVLLQVVLGSGQLHTLVDQVLLDSVLLFLEVSNLFEEKFSFLVEILYKIE